MTKQSRMISFTAARKSISHNPQRSASPRPVSSMASCSACVVSVPACTSGPLCVATLPSSHKVCVATSRLGADTSKKAWTALRHVGDGDHGRPARAWRTYVSPTHKGAICDGSRISAQTAESSLDLRTIEKLEGQRSSLVIDV